MIELLKEKRTQLESELTPTNHEQEIADKVKMFESELRAEYAKADEAHKAKVLNQIEIVDELIAEQEKVINEETINNQETLKEEE